MNDDHISAHQHSIRHHDIVMHSDVCGCFYCCRIFPPSQIGEWVKDGENSADRTALCPFCGIDSVIGSAAVVPLTADPLNRMKRHWF